MGQGVQRPLGIHAGATPAPATTYPSRAGSTAEVHNPVGTWRWTAKTRGTISACRVRLATDLGTPVKAAINCCPKPRAAGWSVTTGRGDHQPFSILLLMPALLAAREMAPRGEAPKPTADRIPRLRRERPRCPRKGAPLPPLPLPPSNRNSQWRTVNRRKETTQWQERQEEEVTIGGEACGFGGRCRPSRSASCANPSKASEKVRRAVTVL